MKIETKLELKEYIRLVFYLSYRKPTTVFLNFVAIIMLASSILYYLGLNIPFDQPPLFQLIFGFIVVFILPLLIYRKTKRNFYSNARLQETIFYEFTEKQIKIVGESFKS